MSCTRWSSIPQNSGAASARRWSPALEARARAEGAITLYLGTDDDFGGTNLFGRDLYPDVLSKAAQLAPTGVHASTFYRRLGFEVVGIIPDANGFGRPDILMAKRIG